MKVKLNDGTCVYFYSKKEQERDDKIQDKIMRESCRNKHGENSIGGPIKLLSDNVFNESDVFTEHIYQQEK